MSNIYEGNAQLLLYTFKLVLHVLTKTQIQSSQRLVKEQYLGPVYKGPCNGYTLHLTAGKGIYLSFLKILHAHKAQHLAYAGGYFGLRQLGNSQAKGNIFVYVKMREKGVTLKNSVDCRLWGGTY